MNMLTKNTNLAEQMIKKRKRKKEHQNKNQLCEHYSRNEEEQGQSRPVMMQQAGRQAGRESNKIYIYQLVLEFLATPRYTVRYQIIRLPGMPITMYIRIMTI
jgi:hypothetical protein